MYRLLLCGIVLLLTVLPACNDAEQEAGASQAADQSAKAVAGSSEAQTSAAQPNEGSSRRADSAIDLTGEWFALFGRTERGSAQLTWDDGHRLSFGTDGKGSVTQYAKGIKAELLPFQWQHQKTQLMLTYYQAQGGITTLMSSAPLGIAIDEEIGLAGSHIDEEIGLMSGHADEEIGLTGSHIDEEIGLADQGKEAGFKPLLKILEISADGSFLAVKDQYQHLMVYARVVDEETADTAETLAGDWVGSIGNQTNIPVQISWDGNQFHAAYELDGSSFAGTYIHGYFVGMIEGGNAPAFAVLRATSESDLNGAFLSAPYAEMARVYDFKRE